MLTEIQGELESHRSENIIVEGKLDKIALKKLGFLNVLDISGKPLDEIAERVASYEAVSILTDYDKDGVKKAAQLTKLLQSSGVRVDFLLRKKIRDLFRVRKIEEINSFVKYMEDDYYGKTCSIYDKIHDRSRFLRRRGRGET